MSPFEAGFCIFLESLCDLCLKLPALAFRVGNRPSLQTRGSRPLTSARPTGLDSECRSRSGESASSPLRRPGAPSPRSFRRSAGSPLPPASDPLPQTGLQADSLACSPAERARGREGPRLRTADQTADRAVLLVRRATAVIGRLRAPVCARTGGGVREAPPTCGTCGRSAKTGSDVRRGRRGRAALEVFRSKNSSIW
uniref:Uncharacterized protein n=1 Tax=Magallana gigas TaxID=29159 RepID=K1P1T2_MAGGI